jgi:hypothetical protein
MGGSTSQSWPAMAETVWLRRSTASRVLPESAADRKIQ